MSIANQFLVLSEEESKKKSNINTPFPEYVELCRAMERGESWYDIMYPRGQDVIVDSSKCIDSAGKKRKQPIDINDISRVIKKPRYN
jgi:hypothetical protein